MRSLSLGVRVLAIGVVAASPWLSPTSRVGSAQSVMYVVDRSASIGDDGLEQANGFIRTAWSEHRKEQLGVIAFDGRAEVLAPVGTARAPTVREGADPRASDLAGAIRLSVAALPREGHRSIVLLTDARPTRGDATEEVRKANDLGIRVDVVPLEGTAPTSPIVTAVRPRSAHVAEHQPVALDVDVRTTGPYKITWTRDGTAMPVAHEWLRENPRLTRELLDRDPPPGVHVYEVKVSSTERGSEPAGDGMLTAVSVEGKAYAAVFASSNDIPPVLSAALKEIGLEARVLPIERIGDPASYSGADLVVLSDVRVTASASDDTGLTRAGQAALVDYVQQGGGLLVTGGVFGLAPEYAGTPIARAIPVEIEDRGHVEDPPVALAIMLDRSGSMAAQVGSHTKLDLAIEASLGAAEVLRPTDQVALASVDTVTHWDIPLGPQDRVPAMRADVRRVVAGGGGIYVYTALKDAYAALADAKTPIRHVILFSDTSDSEQQAEDCTFGACSGSAKTAESLAHAARAHGITTTVVGIGEAEASDTPFLRRLAASAGGRFYLTSEGADLRRIFLSETRVLAQSNLRERKTTVLRAGSHAALEGVDVAKLPELAAYVETGRRSGADTALALADGRPMLATWRYGLGKSAALATDFSEGWSGAWAASPEAAQVLKQSVRFLLRQNDARRADAEVRMRDRTVEIDIELPPDAPESAAPTSLDVYAVAKSGASRKMAMQLASSGPGHWTARGRTEGEPIVIVRARDARGALMAEALGREDRTSELAGAGADIYVAGALARLGEGRVAPTPAETLARTSKPGRVLVATWPFALVAAALLVALDLFLRRLKRALPPRELGCST